MIDFDHIRNSVIAAISPIKAADEHTISERNFLFSGIKSKSSKELPPPYLLYFLFVELLKFRDLGRFEKLAWSIPIDFNGRAYLIEHRKFGVGIFIPQGDQHEENAAAILKLINRGIKIAAPYFQWIADEAMKNSELNVENRCRDLLERHQFFLKLHADQSAEAEQRKEEQIVETRKLDNGSSTTITFPSHQLKRGARWLALAAIDSFFSWTEHIFIHFAILNGQVTTGEEVSRLALGDWRSKFKAAFDINDSTAKKHYDTLSEIRYQIRNFLAHGAFGKDGQAFDFHSSAGAVPIRLPHTIQDGKYSLGDGLRFEEQESLNAIAKFFEFITASKYQPLYNYAQESGLPSILTMARDGTYAGVIGNVDDMEAFIDHLIRVADDGANMDW